MPAAVSFALVADEPAPRLAAEALFPQVERHFLTPSELRPRVPFEGPLFAVLGAQPAGACVGLVVTVTLSAASGLRDRDTTGLRAVADHVNLELRGPLSGPWPSGVPRTFPPVAGIYQPAIIRAAGGARVYSSGVTVVGVSKARRLTPFESRAMLEGGFLAFSDTLVPAAVIAAYYGLKLAACGVPRAPALDRE